MGENLTNNKTENKLMPKIILLALVAKAN